MATKVEETPISGESCSLELKTAPGTDKTTSRPKPCCVCKTEKSARDECLLFNGQESGKCDDLIASYKTCMKGYGFEI